MKKAHLNYLKRSIGIVTGPGSRSEQLGRIDKLRGGDLPVYQMIRDIVCDARFYGVVADNRFWRDYSVLAISRFIDTLTIADWEKEEERTGKKEDFLNTWMAENMMPMTEERQAGIERKIKAVATGGSLAFEHDTPGNADRMSNDYFYGFGIKDKTDIDEPVEPNLPEEIRDFLEPGEGKMSGLQGLWEENVRNYIDRLDPALVEIARKMGRSGSNDMVVKGRFMHASKSDINGIMTGDDLNSLLPEEVAMLALPETERVFYQRYVQKQLQMFSSASSSTKPREKKKGAIYICIDTSSSMSGEPETTAKKLALSIALIAQREQRPVFMVNYSHTLSFFVITDLRGQRRRLMSFLSTSYSGGNDENKLFRFLFGSLRTSPAYSRYAKDFEGADLLMVSDFQWDVIPKEIKTLLDKGREGGMRFHALGVRMSVRDGAGDRRREVNKSRREERRRLNNEEREEMYHSGYDFFTDCDYKYTYNNGRIREV